MLASRFRGGGSGGLGREAVGDHVRRPQSCDHASRLIGSLTHHDKPRRYPARLASTTTRWLVVTLLIVVSGRSHVEFWPGIREGPALQQQGEDHAD